MNSKIIKNKFLKEFKEIFGDFRCEEWWSDNKEFAMAIYTPIEPDSNVKLYFFKNDNLENFKLIQTIGEDEKTIFKFEIDTNVNLKEEF